MRIQVASDLHLEERRLIGLPALPISPAPGADALVLAGDIDSHTHALGAFQDWPVPVLYVHGNHEAYDAHYFGICSELARKSKGTAVQYLNNQSVVLGGVRFLGTCLWTDYRLQGNADAAMALALRSMPDHRRIYVSQGERFSPRLALKLHQASVAWLRDQLKVPFEGKTVVISHHAPHPGCLSPRFAASPLNPAFASDLSGLLPNADLWIHGHTHRAVDFAEGGCRIIANPLGYSQLRGGKEQWENAAFMPEFVVDL